MTSQRNLSKVGFRRLLKQREAQISRENDVLATHAPIKNLRFADHVRACRIDEQVILLDLKRDKYRGVGCSPSATLTNFIADWPAGDSRQLPSPLSGQSSTVSLLLKTLAAEDMLVSTGDAPPSRTHLDEPVQSWRPDDAAKPPNITLQDVRQLGLSAAGAAFWLRWQSLAQIERNVMRLRRQAPRHVHARSEDLHRQVSKYMRLRPFVFSARDRCLHDSLSLIRFLAARALFPQWVIGVRTRPFAAHSWVQSGNLVLNDLHEHVRAFHPILVV